MKRIGNLYSKICSIENLKLAHTINHGILKQKYRRIFKDKNLLWLLDEIIDSTPGDTGVPIGNYISQYSGNIYLSSFDHWIKEEKHIKHYHRYMDDIVIFGNNKNQLHRLKLEIDRYMQINLKLHIKDNWQIFPTFIRGVDFLGYRFFDGYVLLRKSTCKQMKKKMLKIKAKVEKGCLMNYSEWCSVNSYKGWLQHCCSNRLSAKYIDPLESHSKRYYNNVIRSYN